MHGGKPATSPLESTLSRLLDRRRAQSTLRTLTKSPPDAVDFSSNDFLSLSTAPELRTAFLRELSREKESFRLGSGGSRLLDGNSTYAEDLERDIAAFHSAPAGLLCNSGFDANAGLFACIPQPGDIIVYDEMIHASVHDGMRASRAAKCLSFAHNSVEDLRALLDECVAGDQLIQRGQRNVFVAIETVYSMDGDLAPLEEVVEVVEQMLPRRNGHVIVDEAHSTGVFGLKGRGLVCELGLERRVFARLHTFGKALACSGGKQPSTTERSRLWRLVLSTNRFKRTSSSAIPCLSLTTRYTAIILCSPLVRSYLINYARPLIYTTFMPFPSLAAIRAVYTFLQDGGTDPVSPYR